MARTTMGKVDPDNVWKLGTEDGKTYFVKCPSVSGAKIFLATKIGIRGRRVVKWEISHADNVPEGEELLQASFPNPADPANWTEKGRV